MAALGSKAGYLYYFFFISTNCLILSPGHYQNVINFFFTFFRHTFCHFLESPKNPNHKSLMSNSLRDSEHCIFIVQITSISIVKIFSFYTLRHKQKIVNGFLKKNFGDIKNFQKCNFVGSKFLKIQSSINLTWCRVRSHKRFGPDWFIRFDVYCKQTNRQAKYIHM